MLEGLLSRKSKSSQGIDIIRENTDPLLVQRADYMKRKGGIIFAASMDNILFIVSELFNLAYEKKLPIRMVSERFDEEFYRFLELDIKRCLNSSVKVKAMAIEPGVYFTTNYFINSIRESTNGSFRQAVDNSLRKFPCLTIVGDRHYLLEQNRRDRKYVAMFDSPDIGKALVEDFDRDYELIQTS